MQFQVDFGASQSGVGYQFYDVSGVIGSRITAGITNPRTGVYTATSTAGGGAIGIYWDCADADFTAQEDLAERLIVEPNVDATISSRMASYTQPTGFLASTFPSGTIANTTNITAGTIATVSGNVTGSVGSVASYGTLVADVATAVWGAVTRTLTAASDSAGITTLLTRIASVLTITGGAVELIATYDPAKTAAQAGSLANVQDDVDDIQASIAGGLTLTNSYDAAKTAAQSGDVMKVSSGTGANQVDLASGKVNIGKINDTTITGDGQPGTEFGV